MFSTSLHISKNTAISITCYSLSFLHFIGQVISDVVMGVEYYRGYQYVPDNGNGSWGGVKRGSLHVSIGLLIASYAMVIAGILLYITTMVLTIIGFRRRIRLLSYAYLIYLSAQFLSWFDMASSGLSMQINSFFWIGFIMIMLTLCTFGIWLWRAKRTYLRLVPDFYPSHLMKVPKVSHIPVYSVSKEVV